MYNQEALAGPLAETMDGPRPAQEEFDNVREEIDQGYAGECARRQPSMVECIIAWPIIQAARLFALTIALVLWLFIIGPVWFAILLRSIVAFAFATVTALFTGASAPHAFRLDAVATLWIRGFGDIAAIIFGDDALPTTHIPLRPLEALQHTALAILFYTGLAISLWTVAPLFVAVQSHLASNSDDLVAYVMQLLGLR